MNLLGVAKCMTTINKHLTFFFDRSSGVHIKRDICTRLKRYLYSAKRSWIIINDILLVEPQNLESLTADFSLAVID